MNANPSMQRGGRKRTAIRIAAAAAVLLCVPSCFLAKYALPFPIFAGPEEFNRQREPNAPATWAKPILLPGVPNLYKVSDDLYRGAQPTAEGFAELEKLGIKTIVNLRTFHSDRDELSQIDLDYERDALKTWWPRDQQVIRFLRIVSDPNRTPIFVHCKRGADRTGTMCAIYRVAIQAWSKDAAIEEMTRGGFGFYKGYKNLVAYIRNLDIDGIRKRAGITP